MTITKESLDEQRLGLLEQIQRLEDSLLQAQGALQFCNAMISRLNEPEPKPPVPPKEGE